MVAHALIVMFREVSRIRSAQKGVTYIYIDKVYNNNDNFIPYFLHCF